MSNLTAYRQEAVKHLGRILNRWGETPAPQGDRKISVLLRDLDNLPAAPEGLEGEEVYQGLYPWVDKPTESNEPAGGLFPSGFVVPEVQLWAPNYPQANSAVLGRLTFTGGFMEPQGHSWKPVTQAVFSNGRLTDLPASTRNLGVDYVVDGLQICSWFNGTVTRVGLEGGYGNRCWITSDRTFTLNGKAYPVISAYAHAKSFSVMPGDMVTQGQVIGIQGGTGEGGAEHYPSHVDLRLWIEVNGRVIDVSPNLLIRQDVAPGSGRTTAEVFAIGMAFVKRWEGGFVDHVNDYGGRTNFGITQATYDRYRTGQNLKPKDVADLTFHDAQQIYRQKYWRWEARSIQLSDHLEIADFDTCVNFGVAGATMFLQEIFSLPMDGIFGPRTLAAVLANNNKQSALLLCDARMSYRHKRVKEDPSQKVFLQGWLNRDKALKSLLEELV